MVSCITLIFISAAVIILPMSGIVDISKLNTPPEKHELATAKFFSDLGYDVVFLRPSNNRQVHTPDIYMDGHEWEIKCPTGKGKHTIEHNIKNALLQSEFIIFDLRRINIPEDKCISQLQKQYNVRKDIVRLMVITKSKKLITLSRNID